MVDMSYVFIELVFSRTRFSILDFACEMLPLYFSICIPIDFSHVPSFLACMILVFKYDSCI